MSTRRKAVLSYKMTTADANDPEGRIPFGRQFDFIGDVETELMILNDGDESLCLGYTDGKDRKYFKNLSDCHI